MSDQFSISVALAIFAKTNNDSAMPSKCAFYDKDGSIYLPNIPLTTEKYAHELALELLRKLVPVDPRLLAVTPIGFFDSIVQDPVARASRIITLGYRVIVSPGMPVLSELEFKDHEELRIALSRVSPDHFRVFRLGLSSTTC